MRPRHVLIGAWLVCAWLVGALVAPAAAADRSGASLAAVCAACHRLGGAQPGAPTITGWPVDDLARKLRSFRQGAGDNHIMTTVCRTLSDEEIATIARYLGAIGKEDARR